MIWEFFLMPDKYCNYNKKNAFLNCFWLFFELTGTGIEWLDIGLPTPTLFIKTSFGAYVAYAIEGFFATEKNKKFLAGINCKVCHKSLQDDLTLITTV